MSIRIHVAAVHNVPVTELREELSELGDLDLQESRGWVWFTASVWGISSTDLLKKLEALPRTTLLATTEDGSRWYLRLRAPGQEPYNLCHEFANLGSEIDEHAYEDDDLYDDDLLESATLTLPTAQPGSDNDDDSFFNEDDDAGADDENQEPCDPIREILDDKREIFGCPLPRGVEEHLMSLPKSEAMTWLFAWESAGLIGALKRFRVPHDADEVTSIVLGESVTEAERESDYGSLPRLLSAIGLGEYWDQLLEQICKEEVNGEPTHDDEDPIGDVLDMAEDCNVLPLHGDPVEVPLDKVGAVATIARFCDAEANAVFHVTAPAAVAEVRPAWWLQVRAETNADIYVAAVDADLLAGRALQKIGQRLKELPTDSILEVITAGSELSAGVHRYHGTIQNGHWRIDSAAPCADAEALRDAITLALSIAEDAELRASDEAEAEAVADASRSDVAFDDIPLNMRGLVFRPRRSQREALGRLIFRRRFRDQWDVEEGERADAEDHALWQSLKEEVDDSIGIPVTGKTLLEGEASRFIEFDVNGLNEDFATIVRIADAEFIAAGFEPLGALIAQAAPLTVMRVYVSPAEHAWATLYPQTYGESWKDCYTRFSEGASLTTSTLPGLFSSRATGVYQRTATVETFAEVLKHHRRGIRILTTRGLNPVAVRPSLRAFAEAMDEYLVRSQAAGKS